MYWGFAMEEETVRVSQGIGYDCKEAREQYGMACSLITYTSTTASTGQTSIQVPHSVHSSWFMTYFSSPSSMASAGHSSAHVPHATHSSLISYATSLTSLLLNLHHFLLFCLNHFIDLFDEGVRCLLYLILQLM